MGKGSGKTGPGRLFGMGAQRQGRECGRVGELRWGGGIWEQGMEEIGPYLKPGGGGWVSQLCRHLPQHHHRDGLCDDCDGARLAGRA